MKLELKPKAEQFARKAHKNGKVHVVTVSIKKQSRRKTK